MEIRIRTINKKDNPEIEKIIKRVFEEHGINKPGTAYFDESLRTMQESYSIPGSIYFVAFLNKKMIGGAGVYPTKGLPEGTCELVKMYLLPEARGKGFGKMLLNKCFEFAKEQGYKQMYLETLEELKNAVGMYEKSEFDLLSGPLGDTGHYACTIRMLKKL